MTCDDALANLTRSRFMRKAGCPEAVGHLPGSIWAAPSAAPTRVKLRIAPPQTRGLRITDRERVTMTRDREVVTWGTARW